MSIPKAAMMENRQASGRAAKFPCESAADRPKRLQNSAADAVAQILQVSDLSRILDVERAHFGGR